MQQGLRGPTFNTDRAEDILPQLGFRVVDKPNLDASTGPDEPIETDRGNEGEGESTRWTLDQLEKLLKIPVAVLAIITGVITAISGILALIRSFR